MEISEINLNQISHEELIEVYTRTKDYIDFLENEIKSNEVEKK